MTRQKIQGALPREFRAFSIKALAQIAVEAMSGRVGVDLGVGIGLAVALDGFGRY